MMLRVRHDDYHVSSSSSSSSVITVLIIIIFFVIVLTSFYVRFKCPVRPDLRCSRCVDMIIIMTAGDAEDAS